MDQELIKWLEAELKECDRLGTLDGAWARECRQELAIARGEVFTPCVVGNSWTGTPGA